MNGSPTPAEAMAESRAALQADSPPETMASLMVAAAVALLSAPPMTPARSHPQIMNAMPNVMKNERFFDGTHSEKHVVTMGMVAPRPVPARTRKNAKNSQLFEKYSGRFRMP